MNEVAFYDAETKEFLYSYLCNWKFEVGQTFNGFGGYNSVVTKVELELCVIGDNNDTLEVIQNVYVKRNPLNYD